MPSTFGIHRIACGAEIVESSYDYDTQTIGPYKIPVQLGFVPEANNGDFIKHYRIYEELLSNPKAIAAFNLNNYCIVVVEPTYIYEVNPLGKFDAKHTKLDLVQWRLNLPIPTKMVRHIGFVKSYGTYMAVSQYPTYLFQDLSSFEIVGFEEGLKAMPRVNPPLSLYKELITSDAKAVYMDDASGTPMFLKY